MVLLCKRRSIPGVPYSVSNDISCETIKRQPKISFHRHFNEIGCAETFDLCAESTSDHLPTFYYD